MEKKLKQEIQDLRSVQAECQQAEVQILRNLLKCKVYHQVAREGAAGPCVQAWYDENDMCLFCRNVEGAEKTVPFRGLDKVLTKI